MLVLPLAAVVVLGTGLSAFLAAQRSNYSSAPPTTRPTPPPATSTQDPDPTASAGQSNSLSPPPTVPVVRLYSMEVTGVRRIVGPQRSRPGEVSTVYEASAGQRMRILVDFVNPTAAKADVAVRTGLICVSASGDRISFDGPRQVVGVRGDPSSKPGRDPVSSWQSPAITLPGDCRADSSSTDVDGLVWVESTSVSTGGATRISAGLQLA
jgi:hypothetical protein